LAAASISSVSLDSVVVVIVAVVVVVIAAVVIVIVAVVVVIAGVVVELVVMAVVVKSTGVVTEVVDAVVVPFCRFANRFCIQSLSRYLKTGRQGLFFDCLVKLCTLLERGWHLLPVAGATAGSRYHGEEGACFASVHSLQARRTQGIVGLVVWSM
jgi:hypothetical protein